MEKYIIIGYAVLLAILFGGPNGRTGNELGPPLHISDPSHTKYLDAKTGRGIETAPSRNVAANNKAVYR